MRHDSAVPVPIKAAFAACRRHFAAAALFSALVNILYLAPTIYMMQVYDRVVPTGGELTLFWITVIVGISIACLSALDMVRSRSEERSVGQECVSQCRSWWSPYH